MRLDERGAAGGGDFIRFEIGQDLPRELLPRGGHGVLTARDLTTLKGGDRWSLVFSSDDTLVGTAVKPDGNTYALYFTPKLPGFMIAM